jgi:CubicO group peptidase (beta-lactamase class C family)
MKGQILIFLIIFFVSCGQLKNKPEQLNDGIQTGTLKDAGIDEKLMQAMTDSISSGNYTNIHSVLILRNNKLVYEKYFPGTDVTRGIGYIGFKDQQRDTLHDQRSVTKSFVSAAIMITVGQGKIKSLDQRVFDFFPEHAKYDTGMKRNITIKHLLNMSAGLEWNEEISYADSMNSEVRMNNASDAIEFILSQDMADAPGKKFNYSGGCSQLLAEIIEKTTGLPVDKFPELYLFKPLGIKTYTWVKIRDGNPSAASGLRLRSRDMAKFELLYLNDGKWKGKQIIPAYLVAQTLKNQVSTPFTDATATYVGYSNQFWIPTEISMGKPITFVLCQGNGGQIITIDKSTNIVAVVTAGNYNKSVRKSAWDIYIDFVHPAIIK